MLVLASVETLHASETFHTHESYYGHLRGLSRYFGYERE